MDAISMPSTKSVLNQVKNDYPEFEFEASSSFSWSHEKSMICYRNDSLVNEWPFLLHELAHGLLRHSSYGHSIDLLQIERDAWDYARILAKDYDLSITDDVIEQSLDTYRDWLHKRSSCPKCGGIGLESEHNHYYCPECQSRWTVNDARNCGLKRYRIKNRTSD